MAAAITYEVRTSRGAVVRTFDNPDSASSFAERQAWRFGQATASDPPALTVWVVETVRHERQLGALPAPAAIQLSSRRRNR